MSLELVVLAGIGEFFTDVNFILKILALMSIVSFVRNHLGEGPLALIVMMGVSFFILFDMWAFFGTVYVLYMLVLFGITGVLADLFFVAQFSGQAEAAEKMAEQQGAEGPSGKDVGESFERTKHAAHAQKHFSMQPRMMRPPGMG